MFDSPEYASYIQLCRELQLEHQLSAGDWVAQVTGPFGEPCTPYIFCVALEDEKDGTAPAWSTRTTQYVWLPRLDQWLAMLEEAGMTEVDLHGERDRYVALDGANLHDSDLPLRQGSGPTREEASAHLWVIAARERVK